jgi:glycine/D-amino acid oxidase-like deaminating enzyme
MKRSAGSDSAGIKYLVDTPAEGQLHSGKLCQSLLRLVQSMDVTVLNNIEITGYEKVNGHLLLHTQHSFPLIASQLLVCTNAFARQLLPQLDVTPARGQIIVTSPIDNLPFKGTFHFDEGYYYFRNLGDRVLLGGARNLAFDSRDDNGDDDHRYYSTGTGTFSSRSYPARQALYDRRPMERHHGNGQRENALSSAPSMITSSAPSG